MSPLSRPSRGRGTALTRHRSRRFSAPPGWRAAWPPPAGGTAGRAFGVDRWTRDQSGNRPEVTLANAAAAGVADRVEVHTADLTALPFPDGSFDVVTSALAIHNIPSPEGRYRVVDEAIRVLRPGGQLLVADPWPMARRYAAHLGNGTLRGLGPGYWYGGPWLGVTLLHAFKER